MANIRIDLDHIPFDGETVTFKAPCDASGITGLIIYYPDGNVTVPKEFTLNDANGCDIGVMNNIFAKDAIVKVILDTELNNAFVQNPDTNAYLEGRFEELKKKGANIFQGNEEPEDEEVRLWIDLDDDGEAPMSPIYTATVGTSWTADGDYFYQTIAVDGIRETDSPIVDVMTGVDNAANIQYIENMGKVFRITTSDGSITVWASEAIETAFPIKLKVVR